MMQYYYRLIIIMHNCIFKSYLSIILPRHGNNLESIIVIVKIMMKFLNTDDIKVQS